LHLVLVLLIVSFGVAFMLDLAPGDPALVFLGDQATHEQIKQVHQDLGLDRPFWKRYIEWIGVGHLIDPQECKSLGASSSGTPLQKCTGYKAGMLQGEFGTSFRGREPVIDLIWQRLPVTAELFVLTMLLSLTLSIPIGMYCAYRADSRFDRLWQMATSAMIAFPPFVIVLVLVWLFALKLKLWGSPVYFPVTGWTKLFDNPLDNLWHAALPAFTLAWIEIPIYTRLLRADVIQTLQEDYILAARAKGLPTKRILLRHALRPSSFSLLTLAGLSLGRIAGGAVIVETLFALPGLGELIISAINNKDVLVVQGTVMFIAIVYVVISAIVDVLYTTVDPRVRVSTA
jgi:peptide/nickel transport system permease protein